MPWLCNTIFFWNQYCNLVYLSPIARSAKLCLCILWTSFCIQGFPAYIMRFPLQSIFTLFSWPPVKCRRSKFLLQDFSNYDLKGANTVMIFAVPRTMPVLGQKIQSECAHGTNIMAYRFEMPLATRNSNNSKNGEGKQAKKEESDQSSCMVPSNRSDEDEYENEDDEDLQLRANCIYNQEEMRIYRMGE